MKKSNRIPLTQNQTLFTINELQYVSLRAFVLKLKVHSSGYSELLPLVRKCVKNKLNFLSRQRYEYLMEFTAEMPKHFRDIKI